MAAIGAVARIAHEGAIRMIESRLRPGGFALTDEAVKLCGFTAGAQVLDVGCGCGETVEYLGEAYGVCASGIDHSEGRIASGLARNPRLALTVADGCQLPLAGKSMDGILMECSLSELYSITEALHEAYCVLKNGGHLAIHGLYIRHPSAAQQKRMAELPKKTPPGDGECRTEAELAALDDCRIDGALLLDRVLRRMEEIGFSVRSVEDKTELLKHFVGEMILRYGSLEAYGAETGLCGEGDFCKAAKGFNAGYFLLIAEKP